MPSSSSNSATATSRATTARGRKRKSDDSRSFGRPKRAKQGDSFIADGIEEVPNEAGKPRLTTPDLEFDYYRSQLRDPRPTPGRVKRPRWRQFDLPDDIKERFYIPRLVKPKGRLDAFEKHCLFEAKMLMDPSASFHDLYLDWDKVDDWMKPEPYSKKKAVSRMEKVVDKRKREEREMYDNFFLDGKAPDAEPTIVTEYLKDHVSKDLGVPWHQIGPKYVAEWAEKGFPKQKAEEWWREPNETERRRMSKMASGCVLRKDL
ncbi:uncharacterized protein F4812DRAFT_458735 [Daldinia caldariorum]|uniref:uncharacterized protein n=1 Tax=Daldinia caldariorum TaxID=326644 RepID=UPI002008685F|nr:uncharacterized protein F4812DRAFT_458735 [Daldinia caldariorum]KAI1468302.1 hypothetical protein F4812DRAFT_458735 [Daldinia caldariorum]